MSEELTDLKSALDRKSASDLFSNEETSEELRNHPGKYRDRKSSGETSDNDNESTSRVEFDPLKNIVRAPSPLLALLKDKLLKRPILDQVGATSATATLLEHCGLATVDEAEVEVEESSFEEHEKKRVRSDSSHSSTMSTNKRQKSSDNEADRDDDDDSSEDESETEVQSKRKKAKTTGLSGVEPSTSHLTREDEFVLKVPSVTVGLVNQTPAKRKSGSLTPIGSQRAGLTPIGLDTVRGVSSGSKNAAIGSSAVISNQFDAQQKVLELQKDPSIMQGEITDQFAESLFKFQCKEAYPKVSKKESMRLEDYFVATRLWYELLTGCFLEPEAGQRKELSAELISGINNCEFIKKTGETPWQYFSRVNHKTVGGEEVVYLPTLHPIANSDVIPNTAFLQLVSFIYPHFSKLKVEYKNKVHNILREIADDTEAVEMMPILEYAKNEDNERQLLGHYSVDDLLETHRYLMRTPKRAKTVSCHSHWLFGIRAVIIHKLVKDVFEFPDDHLMAGVACVFAYATAMRTDAQQKAKDAVAEKARRDQQILVDKRASESVARVGQKPPARENTTAQGWEGGDTNIICERVLRSLTAAALVLVRQNQELRDLFEEPVRGIVLVLNMLEKRRSEGKTTK